MNQKEKAFYQTIRKGINDKCHLSRIENVAGAGMPDLNIGYKGKDFWVELKHVDHKRFPVSVDWRAQQIAFTMKRNWRGGKVFLFIRFHDLSGQTKKSSVFLFPTTKLIHKAIANDHKLKFDDPLEVMNESIFHSKPNQKPNWDHLLETLYIRQHTNHHLESPF